MFCNDFSLLFSFVGWRFHAIIYWCGFWVCVCTVLKSCITRFIGSPCWLVSYYFLNFPLLFTDIYNIFYLFFFFSFSIYNVPLLYLKWNGWGSSLAFSMLISFYNPIFMKYLKWKPFLVFLIYDACSYHHSSLFPTV